MDADVGDWLVLASRDLQRFVGLRGWSLILSRAQDAKKAGCFPPLDGRSTSLFRALPRKGLPPSLAPDPSEARSGKHPAFFACNEVGVEPGRLMLRDNGFAAFLYATK